MTDTATRPNPKHPAPYSRTILPVLESLIRSEQKRLERPVRVLDPFAGVGRIHQLAKAGMIETVGVELEPEWAACHERTVCADSLLWMATIGVAIDAGDVEPFDIVATSVTYGNRMADHHEAKDGSVRRSYRHDLGRPLTANNSGAMYFGPDYFYFHSRAYRLIRGVLRTPNPSEDYDPRSDLGGLFLLNVSDFVKAKAEVPASMWHRGACYGAGFFDTKPPRLVETPRMNYGANRDRAPSEIVFQMRRVPL